MKTINRPMMCEWRDFSTDTETYTRTVFEAKVGDKFDAMMFDSETDEIPSYIYTKNYVCIIRRNTRMINDISITKIPRNPDCS